jgi:hypothetical protein
MNPSRGPDTLPLPIYEPIFIINCYGQSLWQALFSPYDGFYYAQYEAHYLLGSTTGPLMQTTLIVAGVVIGIVVVWLILSAVWMTKQSLVGSWVASLPDGTHVIVQFEGAQKGGTYKQLIKRDGTALREFGHWTINLADLRLIIMASETKEHPRFGLDTQYWVAWQGRSQVTINGPDRPKWVFRRTVDAVKIDFDSASIAQPSAPPNGGPATRLGNSGVTEGPPSVS